MGSAISGMHYTGMAAARFVGTVDPDLTTQTTNSTFLALAVSVITILFTFFAFGVNWFLRYRVLVNNLKISESRLRTIITTAVDGVISMDSQGRIRDFNRSAEIIFGYSDEEVIGKNIRELMPDPYYTGKEKDPETILSTGFARIIGTSKEVIGIRKDGSDFPVRLAIGHGKLSGEDLFVGFVTDISDRKMIENALKQSEQQVRSLIENIPGITYRCLPNQDWKTLFMSDACESVTGYPVSDFTKPGSARTFHQITHPDDRDRIRKEVDRAVFEKRTFTLEYRIFHKNGEIKWLWENGSGVFGGNGEVLFLDGVILDITERRSIEEALRKAKEKAELAAISKTSFLANMSHEIRTPMNAILGFTEVLLSDNLEKNQRNHLETVKSSAKSLLRLLNDILNTAKLEKGAVELETMDFSLFKLVAELKSTLGLSARKKNLDFEVLQEEGLPEFYSGDSLRIRQILMNLIGNSVKFTDKGKVTFKISRENGNLHFAIQDTGIGIQADRLDKIFEPFTQADVSTTRRFGGTGLGTTICKQLTELMGGQIWAESTLGQGSTFHVLLPLPLGKPRIEYKAQNGVKLPPLRILVVDDVEKNTELVRLLLENLGHTVSTAFNGEEAVKKVTAGSFDLVLMDVQMPGLDGRQATKVIRMHEAEENLSKVPILALTASVFEEDKNSAKDSGMDGFVSKPVDLEQMLAEMARVLGHSSSLQEEKISSFEKGLEWDPQRASFLAKELSTSFQRGSIEEKYLEEFSDLIRNKLENPEYQSFRSKIDQFEFEEAFSLLKNIITKLGLDRNIG